MLGLLTKKLENAAVSPNQFFKIVAHLSGFQSQDLLAVVAVVKRFHIDADTQQRL